MNGLRCRINLLFFSAFLAFLVFATPEFARSEWPVEGIDPIGWVEGMITVPDTSGGVWIIYDSVEPPPSIPESAAVGLKGRRTAQVTHGYLRIQHIDSTGTKLLGEWGQSVIQDTTDSLAWLQGAVPTRDGGVVVAYMALTPYWETEDVHYFGIYGQRFSAEGEPMWQKYGVPLAVQNGHDYFYCNTRTRPQQNVSSDGESGMWVLAYKDFTPQVVLTHIRGNGVVNINYKNLWTIGGSAEISDETGVAICKDDKGGVFVGYISGGALGFEHHDQNQPIGIGIAHYGPDNQSGITATPDGYGGVYFMVYGIGENADIQRVNNQNQPVADPTQRLVLGGKNVCRQPAVLANGDAVVLFGTTNEFRYARFDTLMNFKVNPDTAMFLANVTIPTQNGPGTIAAANGKDVITSLRRGEYIDDILHTFISMHRLPLEGKPDQWIDPVRVLVEGDETSSFTLQRITRLSDGHLLVQYAIDSGYYRFHRISEAGPPVSVEEDPSSSTLPDRFRIESVWPNPFNGSVTIELALPSTSPVALVFYDIAGRKVDQQTVQRLSPGTATTLWQPGKQLASGVYFLQAQSEEGSSFAKKLVLIR